MGNSSSQATSLAASVVVSGGVGGSQGHRTHPIGEHGWVQSFPRTSQRLNALGATGSRVLPQVATPPRLRATNNGEILFNGGTISGRQQQQLQRDNRRPQRGRSMPSGGNNIGNRSHPTQPEISIIRTSEEANNVAANELKRFGSVPDMRYDAVSQDRKAVAPITAAAAAAAARKKYKAPPPPAGTAAHDRSNETVEREVREFSPSSAMAAAVAETRRARRFKTRAEMNKKRPPAPAPPPTTTTQFGRMESLEEKRVTETVMPASPNQPRMLGDLGRSKSLPEFQAELRAITARLRRDKVTQQQEDQKPPPQHQQQQPTPAAAKTFYFYGMPEGEVESSEKIIDATPDLRKDLKQFSDLNNQQLQVNHSVGSPVDGFIDIAPQLRPILPKKQYEVPRFSPAAAWRQLAVLDAERQNDEQKRNAAAPRPNYDYEIHADDDDSGDDFDDGVGHGDTSPSYPSNETRTEVVVPTMANVAVLATACDDSGISGDGDISPTTNRERRPRRRRRTPADSPEQAVVSWTPEQDLDGEDDSNSDDNFNVKTDVDLLGGEEKTRLPGTTVTTRFALRNTNHVFSLSLPRENRLQATGKQEFLRTTTQTKTTTTAASVTTVDQGDNWFFSKSAPNSLNHGPTSLEQHHKHNESGRVMYLPPAPTTGTASKRATPVERQREQQVTRRNRNQSRDRSSTTIKQARSCENLSIRPNQPQNLQDLPTDTSRIDTENDRNGKRQSQQIMSNGLSTAATSAITGRKNRRFTFQSTVRQIERRRLAERLSREAERKERQRLNELAAMQRVEEEFQRKRAREKANLRQQLMNYRTEGGGDDLEYVDDEDDDNFRSMQSPVAERSRPEPDGCCDDGIDENRIHADPPPATQVLSEYRMPRREYMEWQSGHGGSSPVATTAMSDTPATPAPTVGSVATVHPKVVCDMPRATQQRHDHGNNYRRSFAHGVRSHANPVAS